jgi:hypothetical protein
MVTSLYPQTHIQLRPMSVGKPEQGCDASGCYDTQQQLSPPTQHAAASMLRTQTPGGKTSCTRAMTGEPSKHSIKLHSGAQLSSVG